MNKILPPEHRGSFVSETLAAAPDKIADIVRQQNPKLFADVQAHEEAKSFASRQNERLILAASAAKSNLEKLERFIPDYSGTDVAESIFENFTRTQTHPAVIAEQLSGRILLKEHRLKILSLARQALAKAEKELSQFQRENRALLDEVEREAVLFRQQREAQEAEDQRAAAARDEAKAAEFNSTH